jgi:hypothetical protein
MKPGKGEYDEDVVDRMKATGITEPLALEAMQEVVYLRGELAKVMRELDKCRRSHLAEINHKVRHD